jgi:asparagine synthase (glutamine-hydrolysing)
MQVIAGFLSPTAPERRDVLEHMLEGMRRERDVTAGAHDEPEIGLALGWIRREGDRCGTLPVWNEQRNIYLVFCGEHFSDAEEDAVGLIRLYEEMGPAFLAKLNGIFSGVLVDCRKKKAILFNDRFGLGRIYCHEGPEGFYFASEAKALLQVCPELRELDAKALGEFFTCGCALQNRSLFRGVTLLPGASVWTCQSRQPVRKECYFRKEEWEKQSRLSGTSYYEKLSEIFVRILPRYFRGPERVGLSLTGGLDSRMIIAAASPAPGSLPCHTFGGSYRECADVQLARRIARMCSQPHEVIPVTSKFFSQFPDLARRSILDSDGAMDVTGAVELFVNQAVRGSVGVRMTGSYGSEILRSQVALKPYPLPEALFSGDFAPHLRNATLTYAREEGDHRLSFIAFKQVPWHHYARRAIEQSQLPTRSPFLDNELVALAYRAPLALSINSMLAHQFVADRHAGLAGIPTDRGVAGIPQPGRHRIGRFCQEFLPRLEYMYDYGMPQWLARIDHLARPLHAERFFLGYQKFAHFRPWYRDELAPWVLEVLLDPATLARPHLNGRRVEQIVKAHVQGRENHTREIHKLLTGELIQRELIERN